MEQQPEQQPGQLPEPSLLPGKKGSKEWRYLRDTYHVTQSLIIQKIFHIAPWKGPGLRFSWHEWSSKAWIFKLICHLSLLLLVSTLITIINWQWAGYQRAAAAISCRYFLPNTNLCSFDDCIGHLTTVHPTINMYGCSIYQRHDLESAILTAVREYYHINTTSIAQLQHPFQNEVGDAFDNCQPNNDVPTATMVITFNDASEQSVDLFPKISYEEGISRIRFLLNEANVRMINSIQLNFPVLDRVYTDIYDAQYLWNFQINFDKDSAISSFEVSSEQAITHICGIQTPPGISQGDGSGGHGYVYSYEYGIQVTSILTMVVSALYLLSLVLDLMDNTRLTFYVMDSLRAVEGELPRPSQAAAEQAVTAPAPAMPAATSVYVDRLMMWWMHVVRVSEQWMRWLVHVPPVSRKELQRLTNVALIRQQLLQDPFDRLEEQKPVPTTTTKTADNVVPPLAPAALYNISHTLDDSSSNGPSNHATAPPGASVASSVQSTPQGSISASLEPTPLTPEDKQRRSVKFWQQLSYRVKLRLLDGWRLLSIVGAILSLAAACIFVQVRLGYYAVYFPGGVLGGDSPRLMLGLAAAIQYLALLSYLRYSNRFTASALVLWGAFFKVQRIFFAILPLAIGLALLGILVFGNSAETFGDLEAMSITLFSLMNCDSIWQTFVDTTTFSRMNASFVGTLYVSVVFIVFNYLLLRLVLAVVESLYYYLRLYTSACRKRGLFRAQILQGQQDDGQELRAYATAAGVRAHSSQEIQLSLFRIYAKQQLASSVTPPTGSAVPGNGGPPSTANGSTPGRRAGGHTTDPGHNRSHHREETLADALMAAAIPAESTTSS